MPTNFTTFIGVDTGAGRKPFTYIALDASRKVLAVGSGSSVDVLSFALGQQTALLALSPQMRPYHSRPSAPESGLVSVGSFLAQLELDHTRDALTPRTPPAGCPFWLRSAFALADQLESLGYCSYPAEDAARQWIETQSEAAFHALLGVPPFEAGTLEGRIQRQLVLENLDLAVPDAMQVFEEITRYRLLHGVLPVDGLLPQPELNAWIAAHVACLASTQPEALRPVNQDQGGCVYLPFPAA